MKIVTRALLPLLAFAPAQAWAQDINEGEVVVTASRAQQNYIDPRTNRVIEVDDDDAGALPAIGLRRRADNALIPVIIAGDTRDQTQRREEILTMVRSALELARRSNIELAIGDFFRRSAHAGQLPDARLLRRRPSRQRASRLLHQDQARL